eukprot:TRINITY_DN15912_c0_g1_i1.p1 TRINITY_DN15912_c0_g1~~TRINITY_DN15912_c0_g1_i1.p1  ORF type:complete len:256 (-),score=45.25 TRINITY_DN15912_c0_g1_i1:695-1462(-)
MLARLCLVCTYCFVIHVRGLQHEASSWLEEDANDACNLLQARMDAHPAPSVDALVIKSAFDDVHLEGVPAAASRATSMDNRTPSSLLEEELFRGSVRGVTGTILEDRRLFVVLFLLLWACLAAFYGSGAKGGFSQEQEPEKQRDSRWDAVKCLAMFLVLYQHTWDWAHMVPWGSPEDEAASTADPKYIHLLPCRVMLPAFSFVSGVFASGTSSGSGDGSQVVMKQAKLQVHAENWLDKAPRAAGAASSHGSGGQS